MKSEIDPAGIDVVILCGGKGERLKEIVKDRPKPMADIKGRPFLDILIDYLSSYGFKRIILCSGHKGEVVRGYYSKEKSSLNILFSQESMPLGTAGAIKNAEPLVKSDQFLVMNGDSYCPVNLREFIDFHNDKGAAISICLTKSEKNKDYGTVELDDSGRVTSFNEKSGAKDSGLVNAGIYLFERRVFDLIAPGRKLSLEYDIFPGLIDEKIYGYITKKELIDIGTPERYVAAQKILGKTIHEKR